MEKVGNHQKSIGLFHQRTVGLIHRDELIQRIDFHELQAGLSKNLIPGNSLKSLLKHAQRSAIAIMISLPQHFASFREEHKIDSPGIDSDGNNVLAETGCRFGESRLDFGPQAKQVPPHCVGDMDRAVGESVQLLQTDLFPIKQTSHHTAAFRPKIDCQINLFRHQMSLPFVAPRIKGRIIQPLLESCSVRFDSSFNLFSVLFSRPGLQE